MASTHLENHTESQSATADELHIERFKFTGKGSEYFGIWIVNILLTIVTLGIYSAWAKVRNKQYFYGNTYLDDSSFQYTAQPMQILRGRIIAVILLVIYYFAEAFLPLLNIILILGLFIATPWIIMKSMAFNAHHSQYRSIRFQFHQNLFESAKTFILLPIAAFLPGIICLVLVTPQLNEAAATQTFNIGMLLPIVGLLLFYLAYPFIIYISNRYVVCNHAYGGQDFRFKIKSPKPYFMIYLQVLGLGFGITFLLGVVFAILLPSFDFQNLILEDGSGLIFRGFLYLIMAFFYSYLYAFVKAKTYNLVYQNTVIGRHKLRAKIKTLDLAMLYVTNTLGVAFTLGLFIPWAKVRTARFYAQNTALQTEGDLSDFVSTQSNYQNAIGEEIGEIFDIDVGI